MKKDLFLYIIILLSIFSCSDMDDNYEDHIPEINYSGKIKNLRGYVGFERVYLAWDNPTDQKSKTIRIEYDSAYIEYDTLVDSVVIDNLNSGSGYEFFVYTVDNSGNKSVASSKTILPVSKTFINTLPKPSVKVQQNQGGMIALNLIGLSNSLMQFAGEINYEFVSPSGARIAGSEQFQVGDSEVLFDVQGLSANTKYAVDIDVFITPIVGNSLTMDIVPIRVELDIMTN